MRKPSQRAAARRPHRSRIPLLAAALVASLAAGGASAQSNGIDTSEAVLLPGDGVKITVFRRDDYSGTFRINGDSTIAHPLLKQVKVAGVPMDTVNARIYNFLVRLGEANPQVLVEPLFRVVVAGEVNGPDMYDFGTGITIARAISLAGGVAQDGDMRRVRLIRDGRRIPINLKSFNSGMALMTVRSGDQIIVMKKTNYLTDIILPAGGLMLALDQIVRNARRIFGI